MAERWKRSTTGSVNWQIGVMFAKLAPVIFVCLWATGFIGARYGMPHSEPGTFLSLRFASAFALLTIIAIVLRAPWPGSVHRDTLRGHRLPDPWQLPGPRILGDRPGHAGRRVGGGGRFAAAAHRGSGWMVVAGKP